MVFSGDLLIIEKKYFVFFLAIDVFLLRGNITVSENHVFHVFPPQMAIFIGENCDSPADWGTKMPWELSTPILVPPLGWDSFVCRNEPKPNFW